MKILNFYKNRLKNFKFLTFLSIIFIIFNLKSLNDENEHTKTKIVKKLQLTWNTSNLVILVQVHKRIIYLEQLIKSLKNTRYIENSLVIFSHDYIDESIDKLIKRIDFCKVSKTQIIIIFYQYIIIVI
jgi:hypothetical protein